MVFGFGFNFGVPGQSAFTPAQISDLALWLDANDAATVITDGAAQFTGANSEYLSIADSAGGTFDFGNRDASFTIFTWFYVQDKTQSDSFITKYETFGDHRCYGFLSNSTDFIFYTSPDGTSGAAVRALVANTTFSNNTWYPACLRYDSAAKQIQLDIHNGTAWVSSTETVTGINTDSAAFLLGSITVAGVPTNELNGGLDSTAVLERYITDAERDALYNSGAGRTYIDLDTISFDKTDLLAWWDLDEISGTRFDAHGSNDLTDNNTVTSATGIVSGRADDGDPISQWRDKSGNGNHVIQATAGTKPLLDIDGFNGKRALDFDGASYLEKTGFSANPSMTIFIVSNVDAVDHANDSLLSMDGINDFQISSANEVNQFFFQVINTVHTTYNYSSSDLANQNNIYTYSLDAVANTAKTFVNGVESANSVSDYTTDISVSQILRVATNRAATQHLGCAIPEIIIYNHALSGAERAKVDTYLASKWGITL